MWHSLEHFRDPKKALMKVREILKPGGTLILELPNAAAVEAHVFGNTWWGWETPRHLYHFSPRTICAMLAACSFTNVSVSYSPNAANIILSLRNVLCDRFRGNAPRIEAYLDPVRNPGIFSIIKPIGYLLALVRQQGRMVVKGDS